MNIVLDTNVLLVSLPQHSPYYPIYQALLDEKYTLYISNEILAEYEEQIGRRYGVQITEIKLVELFKMRNVQKVEAYYHWNLIEQDPDDNKFVDCSIAANVDYLVTNDKHFNILQMIDFPKVNAINAQSWLAKVANL